jgi:choline-glycine betaine transporter
MLAFQKGGMLFSFWMQLSILLFVAIQLFDHFWADRRENELERNSQASDSALKVWLISKLGLYVLVAVLMVLKPW